MSTPSQIPLVPGSSSVSAASARAPGLAPGDLEEHRRTFARDGYLLFRNVVPTDRLDRLGDRLFDEFDRARAAGRLFEGGGLMAGHLNCFPGQESRFVYDALVEHGIVEVIRAISPKCGRMPNVGCNFNLPGSVVQHYHMDRPFTKDFMVANVAVVDTDLANGAIDVIPGTHQRFYPFWRFVMERAYLGSKRLPMNRGDVLVRTSSLWHRGMPNQTARPRPMVAFTWEDGGSLLPDPFAVENGQITFRPNWYRPDLLGRLRERTYVAAPISYDAYRFVRSFFGRKGYDN
jgi:hypothetical protein